MLVNSLKIENFKSIELLGIKPARVNVFIGQPNSGKTNIIEALAFLSEGFNNNVKEMVRFEEASDLFTDFETEKIIKVETNTISYKIEFEESESTKEKNQFSLTYYDKSNQDNSILSSHALSPNDSIAEMQFWDTFFKYYLFTPLKSTQSDFLSYLDVPFGQNIPALLKTNPELRSIVNTIFQEHGFQLLIRKAENQIVMARILPDSSLLDFRFTNISTTLQKIVFMLLAIKSNKETALIFDEPESNTYPFYTQQIAKYIAEDKSNQYFMTSHSPYLINKLIDKTPADELNIYLTQMKNFRTEVTLLNRQQMEDFSTMGEDGILNLDNLAA